ncbi:MAG: DsrE family protein [Betaproteobacteria bacterium]|nr:DsrE family protein [Betaproteobacteria bacterium]
MKTTQFYALLALTCAGITLSAPAGADTLQAGRGVSAAAGKQKLVIQVSDNDPKKWALALNNAENVQEDLGKDKVDIEIVAYGPGLPMLKLDSLVGGRVAEAMENGVRVVACENTMQKTQLKQEDMLPRIDYVKSGVPEIMRRQAEGYAYVRP